MDVNLAKVKRKTREKIIFYFLIILALFFLFSAILNIKDRVSWKEPTDGIIWGESEKGVVVKDIVGENVPAGIKVGDILYKINEHDILDLQDYYDTFFLYSPDEEVTYTIKDFESNSIKNFKIKLGEKPVLKKTDFYRLILALIYFLSGFFILLRHREARGSKHFFLVCLFSFGLYIFKYTDRVTNFDIFIYLISKFSLMILPALFLHFCLTFPIKLKKSNSKKFLFLLYLPFILIFSFEVFWFMGKLERFNFPRSPSKKIFLDNLNIVYFAIYFLIAVIVLFIQRKKVRDIELKQQMKWIIAGVTISLLPFLIFYIIPYLFNLEMTPLMEASILSLGFMPISFSYAIVKYRLMDVDVIFRRGIIYFIASAISILVYFIILGLSGLLFKLLFPESTTLTIAVSVLVAAFIFSPVRNWVQNEINKIFYREEFELKNSLYELGKTLATQGSLKDMADSVFSIFKKIYDPERMAIFEVVDKEKWLFKVVISSDGGIQRGELVEIPENLLSYPGRFNFGVESPVYEKLGFIYFFPLEIKREIIGAIGIGKSKSKKFLTSEDVYFIKTLSGYISVSFENIRLVEMLKNQLEDIKELKEFNESIVNSINLGVLVFDKNGKILIQNEAMRNIVGTNEENIKDLFSKDFLRFLFSGEKIENIDENLFFYRVSYVNSKNEEKILNISLISLKGKGEGDKKFILVFNDVTDRIKLERELMEREKEKTLTTISAGIAHEINTPLTAILSNVQLAMEDVKDEDIKNMLERAMKECFRASRIVNNFLNFARLKTIAKNKLSVKYLMENTLDLVMNLLKKKNIEIIKNFSDEEIYVYGNESQLIQVFTNLILNARDAIPDDGGRIILEVVKDGNFVEIKVIDNGTGMNEEVKKHLFDPFFTTKMSGKGTGLGLAVSNLIIQEHRGKIFVESEVGKGSTFTVKLPLYNQKGGEVEG